MSFSKMDKRDLYRCVSCGNCRSVCPVFEQSGWESQNTRGRILLIRDLFEGTEADESVFDSLNTCTTCGYCATTCPAGVNPPELVEAARYGLVALGKMTPTQAKIHDNVETYGNTLASPDDRRAWIAGETFEPVKNPEYIFFVGCLDSYRFPDNAQKTYRILNKLGVGLLEEEKCCGSPLLRIGFDADELIAHNLTQIKKSGAHTIIAGCAGCYNTLRNNYKAMAEEMGVNFNVTTVSQFLASHLDDLKKAGMHPLDIKVTYHDPCHSGRHNGIFDEPRQIIEAAVGPKNFIEMAANREKSRCCGGGGGVRSGYNDLSMAMAKRRLEDIPAGVDYLVTTCPLCYRNLRDAAGNDVKVIDIVELVEMAMEK
ncbi:putative iron-sulfur-binding oxidoreductase FadF [Methanosarcinaceae archaeon Ag5]|uniref:Iron-sulfur-binding oxidoreductase FadF n=1 Tax=Methanolapillus africanus TaxID=3028297 RepID=A0AAE4SEI3_9EURY|nr:putative iron-sulfur-binding oxidoreductase FadF [Methanosarcinaceae archaeon Ag5]